MRWLVEVTSLGKDDRESLHVEAETWQKALQVARTQRGESGPMSGFSIELLDDGCRAVDPMSRLRYEVRRATATMPPASFHAPASSVPPRPASHPPPAARKLPAPAAVTMMGLTGGAVTTEAPALPRPDIVAVNVPSQVVFKREQDATDVLPLTYREYVYVVHPGTSEAAAETLLQTQLDLVRTSLERVPAGKLVNLAVFDMAFQGKPPVPPLATLTWKDWRGAAILAFPRRGAPATAHGAPRPSAPPPSQVAPVPAPAPLFVPPQAPPSLVPAPSPMVANAPLPAAIPAAIPVPPQVLVPPPMFAPTPAPPAAVPAPAPMVAPAFVPASVPVPAAGLAAVAATVLGPVPDFAAAQPAPAPMRPAFSFRAQPTEPGARVGGEDLIADLFEAMHDLHFARDAVEGGDFCLVLAMEKLLCQAGIVHLYDIDRREFLISSARGAGTAPLLLRRSPEGDPLLSAAMRRRRALVIADSGQSEAATVDRYAIIGGARSLIIAPVMDAGRFLGAIELVNPLDGQPFTESDGNAVTYIAEQFAEFVANRGVVTDPERIGARQLPEV